MVFYAALLRLRQRRQKGVNEQMCGTTREAGAKGAREREEVTAEPRAFPGKQELGGMLPGTSPPFCFLPGQPS